MRKQVLFGIIAAFVVSLVALAAVSLAYRGNPDVKGPNYNEDVEAQLQSAIEAGDYEAWLKIRQDNNLPMNGRMFSSINEDNFYLYQELHEANLAGDAERADEIRAELGLGQGSMYRGGRQGMMNGAAACGNCNRANGQN